MSLCVIRKPNCCRPLPHLSHPLDEKQVKQYQKLTVQRQRRQLLASFYRLRQANRGEKAVILQKAPVREQQQRCQLWRVAQLSRFELMAFASRRCPPRQRSKVERLNAKVEPLLTRTTAENQKSFEWLQALDSSRIMQVPRSYERPPPL